MDNSAQQSVKALAEVIASLVAVGFVVSVIYDWGFLHALDLDFNFLPSTTADHFRSGLLWFPPLLGMMIAYVAIEFQFQRVERGLTEDEIIKSSSNPEKLKKFREGPSKFIIWSAPLYVAMYLLIGDAFSSVLPMMLGVIWLVFADWCYAAPLIKLRRDKVIQRWFTLFPVAVIVAYYSGYNAAVDAALRKPIKVVVEEKNLNSSINGNLLRTLDKGVLILADGKSVQFIPWDEVGSMSEQKVYVPFRGILCKWFKLCPDVVGMANETARQPVNSH